MPASPKDNQAALLAGGTVEFVTFAARLFADFGATVFTNGPAPSDAVQLKAAGTGSGRSACAEIYARGYAINAMIISVLWNPALTRDSVAEEIHTVVEYLKAAQEVSGLYPRYLVLVMPQRESILATAGGASLRTLVGYLTRHLLAEDVRINLCSCPISSLGAARAAEAAFTLSSGLLDEMRGQELIISDT